MSKITRKSQRVFGQSAGAQQIAQYGSLAAGTPAYSTDPAVIQSLSNWLTGWYGGAVGGNSPAIEDMNAVHYVHSYQLAYLMQTGLPEWDTGTTYFTGSRVNDGSGSVKISRTDNNVGNAITDSANWRDPYGQVPVGAVLATFPNLTGAYSTTATTAADANGWVKCNGQTIADATSPLNGQVVPNINNNIFVMGNTTAGTSGGSNGLVIAHTHTFTSSTAVASSAHTHTMSHYHQWSYGSSGADGIYTYTNGNVSTNNGTFTTTGTTLAINGSNNNQTVTNGGFYLFQGGTGAMYTSGTLGQPSGTGATAQTGSPSATTTVAGTTDQAGTGTDSRPAYISAVYLMRIK